MERPFLSFPVCLGLSWGVLVVQCYHGTLACRGWVGEARNRLRPMQDEFVLPCFLPERESGHRN